MRVRVPAKRVREKFALLYELEGAEKAANFLTNHYRVRKMKIVLNGRKVGKHNIALYYENRAYFTKKGLRRRTVLHELYHHLVHAKGFAYANQIEENEAKAYARQFLHL